MLFTKPSRAQRFFYLLPFLLVMSRLPRRFVFSLLTHGSSCTCPQQLFVWLQKRFFLIQHGWAVKSGAVATLSTRSGQLAQLLTPTSTKTHTHTELHTHTLSTRREAKKAAQQEWWWGGERRTFSLFLRPCVCFCLSFLLTYFTCTCLRMPSPPTRSTSESRAATSYSTKTWVLTGINTSSPAVAWVFVCGCACRSLKGKR